MTARRQQLFTATLERRAPVSKCVELVPLERERCLACGGQVNVRKMGQPALFRHGGYGATRVVTTLECRDIACGAVRESRIDEIRPDRRKAAIPSGEPRRA